MSELGPNGSNSVAERGELELYRDEAAAPQKVFIGDLKPRQQVFVNAYLESWNASDAARKAGYSFPRQTGYRLLTNVYIRDAIDQELQLHHLSREQVLARLGEMATANIADFLDNDGNINWAVIHQRGHLVKWHKRKRKTSPRKDGSKCVTEESEIELYDALRALLHIGRYLGLFDKRKALNNGGSAQVLVRFKGNPDPGVNPEK